jgi:hypothetical protein
MDSKYICRRDGRLGDDDKVRHVACIGSLNKLYEPSADNLKVRTMRNTSDRKDSLEIDLKHTDWKRVNGIQLA